MTKTKTPYVKTWCASITYSAPSRDRETEQRIKTAITECGGTASAFKALGEDDWHCKGHFPTRKRAEQADHLLTAAGFYGGDVYLLLPTGETYRAAKKDVIAQEEAFINKACEDFISDRCMAFVARAVAKALATATENFAAVEKKAVSEACDEFYGVGEEGCPPRIKKAIDTFYSGNHIDRALEGYDYEAAYEKAVDKLLVA